MGEEIARSHFNAQDQRDYARHMAREMRLLSRWFEEGRFSERAGMAGFELEAWLVDGDCRPAPLNDAFLARADDPLLAPELARFNIELNVDPRELCGDSLRKLHKQLDALWARCRQHAGELGCQLVMTGILPTLQDDALNLGNMSAMKRYQALNAQVMRARQGRPLRLDIVGEEHLVSEHRDVMLESAATSFQIHRQVPQSRAVRYYNAAIVASAPVVALAANAPFLFGRHLWQESRIPLFEQAVEVGGYGDAAQGPLRRVSFGSGYAGRSLEECFVENTEHYPVLLPVKLNDPPEYMRHVRLHNGTIWRWNRPLIGFDDDGRPHLRIEHRVAAAGPTVVDEIATAAFFYGLQEALAGSEPAPEQLLEFARAKDNFYRAARHGIEAQVQWLDGRSHRLGSLILQCLMPQAREGLENLAVDRTDIAYYLSVVYERVSRGQTGAAWQVQYAAKVGGDMTRLTRRYLALQQEGLPVHQWPL